MGNSSTTSRKIFEQLDRDKCGRVNLQEILLSDANDNCDSDVPILCSLATLYHVCCCHFVIDHTIFFLLLLLLCTCAFFLILIHSHNISHLELHCIALKQQQQQQRPPYHNPIHSNSLITRRNVH